MSKFIRIVAVAILILSGCQQDVILYQPSDNVSKIYYTTKNNVALSSDTGVINFSDYDIIADLYDNKDGGILYISGTMYNINDSMFRHHEELTTIIIPDSVTTIGDYAFYYCESLTSVTIPDSVTTIGEDAFCSCNSLTSVYCKATTPPTLDGSSVFDYNKSGRKIYVPTESVEAYKSAENWSDYADDIVGYNFGDAEDDNNKENDSDDNGDDNDIVKPANNEIWYTATALVEPNNASAFNVAITSNEWDEATGEGIITFDGELTTIGDRAFYDCRSLTSVTIPDSVTTIGTEAFVLCFSLTSVTIGDSVTTIGDSAFSHCYRLTSITIPDSVTTIEGGVFGGCDSLAEFKGKFAADGGRCLIKDNAIIAYAYASGTTYTIPVSVTTIGDRAFLSCDSLTSVTIGNSVTTIGEDAFYYCESLTSVTIGNSVTTIGDYAFQYCESLTSVTIPDSVTTIEHRAFFGCGSLTSVTIPDSVTTIEGGVFGGCSNLAEFKGKFAADGGRCLIKDNAIIAYAEASGTTYTIPDYVTTIGDSAFDGCRSLESVTIGDSVTTIGDYAFYVCSSLTSVTIGDSVTTIGEDAFYYCESLTSVTIPDSVTTIGEWAFYDCTSLTSVTIGDSVTTIGDYAFRDCDSLTSVYCEATTPPDATASGFSVWGAFDYNASDRKIYVPAESVEAYKAAKGWSKYADDIVGYDFE